MRPTLRVAGIITPKPHVPLIHFLGKRSLLATQKSKTDMRQGGEKKLHNVISYTISADELPQRFRFKSISLEEIEAVETGGATHISA